MAGELGLVHLVVNSCVLLSDAPLLGLFGPFLWTKAAFPFDLLSMVLFLFRLCLNST